MDRDNKKQVHQPRLLLAKGSHINNKWFRFETLDSHGSPTDGYQSPNHQKQLINFNDNCAFFHRGSQYAQETLNWAA